MDDATSKIDELNIKRTDTLMSAEKIKIKFYECNDENNKIQILENERKNSKDKGYMVNANYEKIDNTRLENGEIMVISLLEFEEHEYLQGVKINLYKINGLSPVLIKSKTTDEEGKVVFSELEEGCYRIIEIIDKKYFEKPKYINWNEIIIDGINKNQKVLVVNKIKGFVGQDKHKHWI